METRSRGDMLPLKQKLHKLGRGHWFHFFSQPADGQTMNARQQSAVTPLRRGDGRAGIFNSAGRPELAAQDLAGCFETKQ